MSVAVAMDTAGSSERRFQLLALSVRIATDCPILDGKLEYLAQDACQDYDMTGEIHLHALRQADGYRICEAGTEPRTEADSTMALGRLHFRSYQRAYEMLPRSGLFLHAACGSYEGRRFLLLGESGAGKTTLITRLLGLGALAEGDELALLEGAGVSALPRRFHIKSTGIDHFPWLGNQLHRLPRHDNGDGTSIYAFAPSDWGFPWHIRNAGIDAVLILDPNHGGQSRIREIPHHQMIQYAIAHLRPLDQSQRSWLPALCRHFDRAFCGRLVLGSLDSAASLLISKLSDLPAPGSAGRHSSNGGK